MAVTVQLTGPLRKVCGASSLTTEGATVAEVLRAAANQCPDLSSRIFKENGSVNRFVAIWANGVIVDVDEGLANPVADGDEIRLVPAVVGG